MSRETLVLHLLLGGGHLLSGVMLIVISLPLLRDQIPMNNWYGVRTRKSLSSEESWYALNRYGARQMIAAGAVLGLFGILCFFLPFQPGRWHFWLVVLAPLIVFIPVTVNIFRYGRRLP